MTLYLYIAAMREEDKTVRNEAKGEKRRIKQPKKKAAAQLSSQPKKQTKDTQEEHQYHKIVIQIDTVDQQYQFAYKNKVSFFFIYDTGIYIYISLNIKSVE